MVGKESWTYTKKFDGKMKNILLKNISDGSRNYWFFLDHIYNKSSPQALLHKKMLKIVHQKKFHNKVCIKNIIRLS